MSSHRFFTDLNGTLIIYWIETVSGMSSVLIDMYSFASIMLTIAITVCVMSSIMESLDYFFFVSTLFWLYLQVYVFLPNNSGNSIFFFICSIMSINDFFCLLILLSFIHLFIHNTNESFPCVVSGWK